ncbi:MAG: carbon-nitrogen hydrolase family protein [Thermoanaerobacteraceae bacterium]|nr:carbon-nitrogen hydrolase family protein [Thermoanaerobacteraceae bacterium]
MVRVSMLQVHFKDAGRLKEDLFRYTDSLETDLLVLPPFIGSVFQDAGEYMNFFKGFSRDRKYLIVPGSFYEDGYHKAVIMLEGRVIHQQCQTHLSGPEEGYLKRGDSLDICESSIGRLGILMGNDCYHPQTGRILGLQGADIVIGLYTAEGIYNRWLQISGIWQQVQQNQFFAVECSANGYINGKWYSGRGIMHNPIWDGSDGFLEEMPENMEGLITCNLDFEKLKQLIKNYPLYRYLNKELYRKEMGY